MAIRAADAAWQVLPLRDADPLNVHTLRTEGATATVLARFHPGWSRSAPARCVAAEEFVVLEGRIEVNGTVVGPGSVTHVPAGAVRATTTSTTGCTAVAWFVGALRWERVEATADLQPGVLATWQPGDEPGGADWATPLARWSLLTSRSMNPGQPSDVVDLDEASWAAYEGGATLPRHRDRRALRRTPTVS